MQGTGINRRRIITVVIAVVICALLVSADQYAKVFFKDLYEKNGVTCVIENFFYFDYTVNTGAAYGMLSGTTWGQTFFKIITPIALIGFCVAAVYAIKHDYKFLLIALILVVSGTVGNYIDRLFRPDGGVIDFFSMIVNGNRIFGIFNVADVFMSVGVVMLIIHLLFIDKNGLFKVKNGK